VDPALALTMVPAPTPPAPVTLPNLVPHWKFATDGPIVVSSTEDTSTHNPIVSGQPAYVDISVQNLSLVDAGSFSSSLYLDDESVETLRASDGLSGRFTLTFDDRLLPDMSTGEHTLRLVIDPTNAIAEHDEFDNTYELTLTSFTVPPPTLQPATFTDAEIDTLIAKLPSAADDRRPVLGDGNSELGSLALELADVGYYLMTGTSTRDERLRILLLDRQDYESWIDTDYVEKFATSPVADHASILARREKLKTDNPAFKTRDQGRVILVVDAERPFADVLSSLAHELGHANQDFQHPEQATVNGNDALDGIQEAQAQQFERAFWLTLEARLGTPLMAYPTHAAFISVIDAALDGWLAGYPSEEHDRGHLIQWLAVLTDPSLATLKNELTTTGGLTAAGSLTLFSHLVAIEPANATSYVNGLLAQLTAQLPTIRALAEARLTASLPLDGEGLPDLTTVGLATP